MYTPVTGKGERGKRYSDFRYSQMKADFSLSLQSPSHLQKLSISSALYNNL